MVVVGLDFRRKKFCFYDKLGQVFMFISQKSVLFTVMPKVKSITFFFFYKIYKRNDITFNRNEKGKRQFRDVRLHIEINFITKAICSHNILYTRPLDESLINTERTIWNEFVL